ncbi:MAG: ABC transporter ATP-binding protein [Sediminibacterium sp.]|nr:ABC transporter ATP-binding protein [Chitinophagaceae bacterium]MCA6447275.1 ABC transporter ATP-binding protein [Chitinophagaceae bacterium]
MFVEISHISKYFAGRFVLSDISLNVARYETVSILGKSGCGKSTLLKIIAGIEKPNEGSILINGSNISNQYPHERNIVYLFQEALLFPNLNVFENIAFGLRIKKIEKTIINQKVSLMIEHLGLTDHSKKMPNQLSGGQKQRVSFGRALIINPPLILLDEPFSNLDTETRGQMQDLYKKVAMDFHITALFVTHDIKEALLMGDRMTYLQDGKLKIYNSKQDFINDEITGAKKEISFWNNI